MVDKEKVIKGLGNVANAIVDGYICEPDQAVNTIADAISLLKEQEPIPAIDVTECGWREDGCRYGKCPKCGKWIMSYNDYCGYCGQAVKWEL